MQSHSGMVIGFFKCDRIVPKGSPMGGSPSVNRQQKPYLVIGTTCNETSYNNRKRYTDTISFV